jgi:hypothetical protein
MSNPKNKPGARKEKSALKMTPLGGGEEYDVELDKIPRLFGGESDEVTVSHPVLERSARLNGMTPEAFLASVEEKRGVKVNVIEIPKEEKFFLISTTERTFPDDIARPCCNCGKTLLVSSDVPPNAVSICAEYVHLQGIFARTATSAAN